MFGLRDSDLELIRATLKNYPNITEAILFGSRAKGTEHPGSDVDIALKGEDLHTAVLQVRLALNQESLLPYDFDIIDYYAIDNQALVDHINRVGKLIYP